MLLFTKDHHWVWVKGRVATVGITKHAADQHGEIVFLELPQEDYSVKKDTSVAVIESVKAATDLSAPISGTIMKVNENLESNMKLLQDSPEKEGWLYEIEIKDCDELSDLMVEEEYRALIKE